MEVAVVIVPQDPEWMIVTIVLTVLSAKSTQSQHVRTHVQNADLS